MSGLPDGGEPPSTATGTAPGASTDVSTAGDPRVAVAAIAARAGVPAVGAGAKLVLHPGRQSYVALVEELALAGFDLCADLCAVDYLGHMGRTLPAGVEGERFEVVVNLVSIARRERVRVRVQVPESDPSLPSLFLVHPGSEAMEREAYDMFGIGFDGHPDLTRILMPEDWEGHPLRKDYSVGRVPVQFKDAPGPR